MRSGKLNLKRKNWEWLNNFYFKRSLRGDIIEVYKIVKGCQDWFLKIFCGILSLEAVKVLDRELTQ